MEKNHSYELGVLSVAELIDFLQSLPDQYRNWPIYFCGSDEFFLCGNEEDRYIVADMEDLFEEFDDEEWIDDLLRLSQ